MWVWVGIMGAEILSPLDGEMGNSPVPRRAVSPPLPVSTGPGSGCPARSLVGPRGMGPLTCFRMMSVACMMHLGSSPWLRARMAACSRERLRVLLQGGSNRGGR